MSDAGIAAFSLALGAVVWYWWDSVSARDSALRAVREACRQAEVQLLDHALSKERMRPVRDDRGKLCMLRVYAFEFTSDGSRRNRGIIAVLGRRVLEIHMEPYRIS